MSLDLFEVMDQIDETFGNNGELRIRNDRGDINLQLRVLYNNRIYTHSLIISAEKRRNAFSKSLFNMELYGLIQKTKRYIEENVLETKE